ncbi:5-formyltetrahydrofolate cyclo-ligase [uncultured Stenotrophomonas sp.]|uniref:5-formyltetrahydrofolate cyclo-ligase n=1 Tax=uncultured Stenotrophomonas sp. TaxID=165438 RepID=UPI0028D256A1|nr:5-formyltetrahydrofolate cyclo-ligase [uncultured Stenotrophomonas sp.]
MTDPRSALRQQLRQRRRDIPAAQRLAAAEQLADALLALPFAPTDGHVAGYWALDGEIALHRWQMRLPDTATYCLPVLAGDTLRFAPWRPGQPLTANRYGIPEPDVAIGDTLAPAQLALVVAPLVGFDAQGRRLGMGGGWYDRSFAFRQSRPAPPWLVGVGFSVQQVDALPVQPWDVAVDAICTDATTITPVPTPGRYLPEQNDA